MTAPARTPRSSGSLEDVTGNDGGTPEDVTGNDGGTPEDRGQQQAAPPPASGLTLPTKRRTGAVTLESKSVLIYGPPGIGKSTFASEFGTPFFFDIAGELGDLEVFAERVTSWKEFREWGAAYVTKGQEFTGSVIDTADVLTTYCSAEIRQKLGIAHESDAEWGKGWSLVKDEFALRCSKLLGLPGRGAIFISHSEEVEIKTRSETYNKAQPTVGPKGVREWIVDSVDLILYVAWSTKDEGRVIHTKPSRYHVAKERSSNPRLPAEIEWPLGVRGIDVLREAWGK